MEVSQLYDAGRLAALRVWEDEPDAGDEPDPRVTEFADGALTGFSEGLRTTPGVMKRVVRHAGAAAEDLNVDAYQGLVEVLQNADDLGATTVRFAIAEGLPRRLLIIHDGAPVTYPHVLAMMLPYLTTKSGDSEQKGRFGIGLKTLKRISTAVRIHSAPYHFTTQAMDLLKVEPALGIEGIYRPGVDTLFELDLLEDLDADDLGVWFDAWPEDNLLFLRSVRAFVRHDLTTGQSVSHRVSPGVWRHLAEPMNGLPAVHARTVKGSSGSWVVYKVESEPPEQLNRSHKAKGASTTIQIAVTDQDHPAGLFIGFRTRIPVSLPFSIDAQFDPSTTRESLIANPWNRWLIKECGAAVVAAVIAQLAENPVAAWRLTPLEDECIGNVGETWPAPQFGAAFVGARERIGAEARVRLSDRSVSMDAIVYEAASLSRLLSGEDLVMLSPGSNPLPQQARDLDERWRSVLDTVGLSRLISAQEVAQGFRDGRFGSKETGWWISAGDVLVSELGNKIFGTPAFLTQAGEPRSVAPKGETARGLVVGETLSPFAETWSLFERLHDDYAETEAGRRVLEWLFASAAVRASVDAADELRAFSEAFAKDAITLNGEQLKALRDRFDLLSDVRAATLGSDVGRAVLLDGYVHRAGKRTAVKVRPVEAYLSRTLDADHPFWPDAAGDLPQISWLSASYDTVLKTGAGRSTRRRADGVISRGPRKFLMLLGAACSPRIVRTDRRDWGGVTRTAQLRDQGAEFVPHDFVSPDLEKVLLAIERAPRKDRKIRSAALLKCLSRYWPAYTGSLRTPAHHMAIKYVYDQGEVTSDWVCRLIEVNWIAVGSGTLRRPSEAVVKTSQTQTLYAPEDFIAGVTADDIRSALAVELKIITDVRASDLVTLLQALRETEGVVDLARVMSAYRSLAKLCPGAVTWNSKIGDLGVTEFRQRFSAGKGLIIVPDGAGGADWKRPADLFIGKDIFLDPARFVPGGPSLTDLWQALLVRKPGLDDCIEALKDLGQTSYGPAAEAVLIEIYRYVEPLTSKAERRQKDRLRALPVGVVSGNWSRTRPVLHIDDRELRSRLSDARQDLQLWSPPCDVHALPNLVAGLGLTVSRPGIVPSMSISALDTGEALSERFRRCVDLLSNELARNDPATRERLGTGWTELSNTILHVHEGPFDVQVLVPELGSTPVTLKMRAVLQQAPLRLHVDVDAMGQRDGGGRAIASLFPADVRRRIEAEWLAAWQASGDLVVVRFATASDEAHERAMAERAASAAAAVGVKIKVKPSAPRSKAHALPPRRLKKVYGTVTKVTVLAGKAPVQSAPPRQTPLTQTRPEPPPPPTAPSRGAAEYTNADLEHDGWGVLTSFLDGTDEPEIVDFRRRHGVGADGVIAWKTFIELKATALGPQSSVEMSASEFERAKERGLDFIIALVSGLEEGQETEIRLILDPANRAAVRPIGAVRLSGLAQCASVSISITDAG